MKKIFFFFLGAFFVLFACLFAYSTYQYYKAIHLDDPINPYLFVEKWTAVIARKEIAIEMVETEKYNVREWDVINVHADSLAVLHWPDGSLTRLDENTKFFVEKMQVSRDYSRIEFSGKLEKGKIWSNMIRTLYPGSSVTVTLPNGVVAGVRGTVFSIDLEHEYIHAVEHVVTVKNRLFQSRTVLPDEAVSTIDIFKNISLAAVDRTWEEFNKLQDVAYEALRETSLDGTWNKLAGSAQGVFEWWDRLVRKILGNFDMFRDIKVAEELKSLDATAIMNMPQEMLLEWYQKTKSENLLPIRDMIRGELAGIFEEKGLDKYSQMMTLEAIWDKEKFGAFSLENADKLISKYAEKMNIDLDIFWKSLTEENYTELFRGKIDALFRE